MADSSAVLFLDTGSPVTSIALGGGGEVLAERTIEQRRTSERLLAAIEEALAETGVALADLDGLVALQGPGSFTGLRIGLATAMGLCQALGVRATALPTLPVLALAAGAGATDVHAAVDATRGEWVVQRFHVAVAGDGLEATARSDSELAGAETLLAQGPCRLVGFGIDALDAERCSNRGIERIEPPPLAAVAARWLRPGGIDWRQESLTSPIYFRPPAVTLPQGSPGVTAPRSSSFR